MARRKNHFALRWASKTNIGKEFGLSGGAVGRALDAHGLRNPETGLATFKAVNECWCVVAPLKNGELHYLWSVEKVETLLASLGHATISYEEQLALALVTGIKRAEKSMERGRETAALNVLTQSLDSIGEKHRQAVARIIKEKFSNCYDCVSHWGSIDENSDESHEDYAEVGQSR